MNGNGRADKKIMEAEAAEADGAAVGDVLPTCVRWT